MSIKVSKTITSATKFADFCKTLDICGNLFDSDLETLYSYADAVGYDLVLVDNFSQYVRRFYLSELLFTFLDSDGLGDLAFEIGLPDDLIEEANNDELSELIEKRVTDKIDKKDFADIVDSFLPAAQYVTPLLSDDYGYCFLVMNDCIFE
ncbi:hypothetical protein [uncultured Prevotella sp.]|uniref:hypothetical protein n=1 Tax=uncultured Prevotella sp. TaxID=159272 RepID=UPI00259BB704|nr:hypothetical protein [uncultured Prevotella sp.]